MKALWLPLACLVTQAVAAVPEPAGYRLDHYNAPVPDGLRGGTVLDTASLSRLLASGHAAIIDVLPAPAPPADTRPGMPRMPLPHRDIPGSLWLPDVGRGALSPQTEAWFRARLAEAAHGDKAALLVFYCRPACWMSWNAAKRAISFGYTHVMWYPDGVDGWQASGHALADATPHR